MASDGRFWVSRVLATVELLEKDTKHVRPLNETDEEEVEQRQKARQIISRLKDVSSIHTRWRSYNSKLIQSPPRSPKNVGRRQEASSSSSLPRYYTIIARTKTTQIRTL